MSSTEEIEQYWDAMLDTAQMMNQRRVNYLKLMTAACAASFILSCVLPTYELQLMICAILLATFTIVFALIQPSRVYRHVIRIGRANRKLGIEHAKRMYNEHGCVLSAECLYEEVMARDWYSHAERLGHNLRLFRYDRVWSFELFDVLQLAMTLLATPWWRPRKRRVVDL